VPRKRIQPNKRWLISKPPRPVARPLSTAERARLKEIPGLPEAALPAVEEIAARFIRRAKYPTPSKAETRAALRFLRNQVTRLRKAISETDLYTLHVISPNYVRRLRGDHGWKQDDPGLLERVDSHLNELLMKIDFVKCVLENKKSLPPATSSTSLAREVQATFQKFEVPFSLGKDSPATETVEKILDMVRPAGPNAAREAVRRVERARKSTVSRATVIKNAAVLNGDRKKVPA
jgi:hypothetical protein